MSFPVLGNEERQMIGHDVGGANITSSNFLGPDEDRNNVLNWQNEDPDIGADCPLISSTDQSNFMGKSIWMEQLALATKRLVSFFVFSRIYI